MSDGKARNKHPPLSEMPPARDASGGDSSRAQLPNQTEMKGINALNLEPASRESQSTAKSRADRQPLSGKGGDRSGKSSREGASPAGDQSKTALNPSAKEFSLNTQAPSFTLPGIPARQTALSPLDKPMVPFKLAAGKPKLGLDDILSACFQCMQSSDYDPWPVDFSAPKYNRILGQYNGPAPTMPGGLGMAAAAAMQQQQQQQQHHQQHQQQQQQQQPQWPPGPQGPAGNASCGGPCNNGGPMGPPNGGGGGGGAGGGGAGYSQSQNMQGMGQGAMVMMMPQGMMPNMQAQQGVQQGGMQPQMFFMPTQGGGGYMVQNGQGQPGMQQQGMQMGGMFPQGNMQQMGMQGGGMFQPGGNMQMQQGMQMPQNMMMGAGCGGMNGGGGKPS